jgi:hypothetical protein
MVPAVQAARAPEPARNIQVVTARLDPPNVLPLSEPGLLEARSWLERLL